MKPLRISCTVAYASILPMEGDCSLPIHANLDVSNYGRASVEQEALKSLGTEPLSEDFTSEILAQSLAGRKSPIKQVLLNQEVIAGLGNIYADEALYYASIHPLRRANSLTPAEVHLLHEGIVSVLTLGIEHGGTSSASIEIFGEKLAITTTTCVSITNRESLANAVARLSSVLSSLIAVRIFVQNVRNLHWSESKQNLLSF